MTISLSRDGLDAGRKAYLQAVRRGDGPSSVVEAIVAAYLDVAPSASAPKPRLGSTSALSRELSEMRVGDSRILANRSASNLARYFDTARRIMGIADAKWTARSLPDGGVKVTRNPNGIGLRDPARNPVAVKLAAMARGESILDQTKTVRQGGAFQQAKHQARRILGDQTADWTTKRTTRGLRITRKAPDATLYIEGSGAMPSAVRSVFSRVCAAYGVTTQQIRQPTRGSSRVCQARMEIMVKLRALKTPQGDHRYSYPEVGAFVNRHHTTVMHAIAEMPDAAHAA